MAIEKTQSYFSTEEKQLDLVNEKKLLKSDIPILTSLLYSTNTETNSLFSLKKVDYNEISRNPTEIKSYGSSRYYGSVVKSAGLVVNYSTWFYALRPLDQRCVDMLYILLDVIHNEKSNKVAIHIKDIFDKMGYKVTSRPARKQDVIKRFLSLSYLTCKTETIEYEDRLSISDFDNTESRTYETGLWSIFDIEFKDDTFYVSCNDRLFKMYNDTHWKALSINEYRSLTSDVEKTIYRYLAYKDMNKNNVIHTTTSEFFSATRLDQYEYKHAKTKALTALKSLKEKGFVKSYEITARKKVMIEFVLKKERMESKKVFRKKRTNQEKSNNMRKIMDSV